MAASTNYEAYKLPLTVYKHAWCTEEGCKFSAQHWRNGVPVSYAIQHTRASGHRTVAVNLNTVEVVASTDDQIGVGVADVPWDELLKLSSDVESTSA